jgi:serine/threonine protein kinase
VFDQHLAADPDVRRRLSVGALAASVVREPQLAPVIDFGDHAGQPWVASTLVRGPSLAAAITETGPVPAATAGWIALGLARTLAALHEAGLTHHAVTPHNVLLDASGQVLTDLGVSRTALVSGPGTAADDIRMLGVTVLYAATGRFPWGDAPADAGSAVPPAGAAPPGAAELAGCPPWLVPVVLACLDPDPAARPAASEVHAQLAGETGQQPRSWLPGPVAARVAEYAALPPSRGRFRWPRGRD